MKFQHCPDQSVVCPAFGTTHSTYNSYISQVSLSNDDAVNQVPLFGPGVHPGGFELICLAEDDVGDAYLVFSTLAQEEQAIGIHFPNTLRSKYPFLAGLILPYSSIEATHDQKLVTG